jgi:hypothetical protein
MTPLQQENVELIRALRKELQNIDTDFNGLLTRMENGMAGRKEVLNASIGLINARVFLKDALGETGREEYQREE